MLRLLGARANNLKNVNLDLPIGLFVCVTGVSGSGKSTLINDTLYHAVAQHLYGSSTEPAAHDEIEGLDAFDKVVNVDQSPIGRTPRSNPATCTGLFTPIRDLFAGVPLARERGMAVLINLPFGRGRLFSRARGKALPPFAADIDCSSWAQFFLKFLLANPAVTAVIPSTDRPEFALDNLNAARGRIPDARMREQMIRYWDPLS